MFSFYCDVHLDDVLALHVHPAHPPAAGPFPRLYLHGGIWANFKLPPFLKLTKYGPFRCMVRSNPGRDTGRDTCRAVGSWSHPHTRRG